MNETALNMKTATPNKYTLGEASKATGVSKPTISRALKRGDISGSKNSKGQFELDPAEVHRVWPMKHSASNDAGTVEQSVPPNNTKMLEREIEILREQVEDLKAQRNDWKEAHNRVTALIEDKRENRGIMARIFGSKK